MVFRVRLEEGSSFEVREGEAFLGAALRAGIGFPYDCCSGGCGTCRFELLEGSVDDLWPEAPGLSPRDKRKGKLLACQSAPTSDCTVRVRTEGAYVCDPLPQVHGAVLAGVRHVTHDMREFTFRTEAPARFKPGQYARLSLKGAGWPRAYSMSNLPNPDGIWQFIIRRVPDGGFSNRAFDVMKVGDTIGLEGPLGMAWLREDNPRDIVCIAGGSGLAPMLSIARRAARLVEPKTIDFYYGARTPKDVCGESLLEELPGFGKTIRYCAAVCSPDDTWNGRTGFIHTCVEADLGPELKRLEFYMAGPPPMIEATQEMLVITHGVPVGQIHLDRFY